MSLPPRLLFCDRTAAAGRVAYRILKMTEFRMAITTVGYEKGNERANTLHTGTINDRTALSGAAYQSGASKDGKMGR